MGGRNIYWNDADGHVWEILTVSYARPRSSTAVRS
jgi:predicted lactoylglutathione lyase